jgi:hypothetical protein
MLKTLDFYGTWWRRAFAGLWAGNKLWLPLPSAHAVCCVVNRLWDRIVEEVPRLGRVLLTPLRRAPLLLCVRLQFSSCDKQTEAMVWKLYRQWKSRNSWESGEVTQSA